ncbi:hypothetical protein SAMN05421736_11310 [Evansella caseinilytica]|uniref:Uncharacterized protein n=1 Tax=Evansella caseinilytica TaxID=1503961 RepID=A0A1H3T3G9_9BACI|nr:hypothetical protein [Evansella caseinilytica]SDZ44580.1 hypothetical protein SAMN05421736_11310 [Evansella caseinilytica]
MSQKQNIEKQQEWEQRIADLRASATFHKTSLWLHSPDPEYKEKVNDIVGFHGKAGCQI